MGIAIDADGNLWVTEYTGHRILRIRPDGVILSAFGTGAPGYFDGPAGQAQFSFPAGVAVSNSGFVYLSEPGTQVIRRISPDGAVSTVAGLISGGFLDGEGDKALFDAPLGIAVRNDTAILVADSRNHRIRQIDLMQSAVPPVVEISTSLDRQEITVRLSAAPGQRVELQSSVDLLHWITVETLNLTDGTGAFSSALEASGQPQFYRAVSR